MDVSPGCYLTNYIFAITSFYLCYKTTNLSKNYKPAANSKPKIETLFIHNSIPIICFINTIASILGGIFHQFPKRQMLFNLGAGCGAAGSAMFLVVQMFTFKNSPPFKWFIMKNIKFILPLIAYTEFKTGIFQFKKLMIASHVLGFMVCFMRKPVNFPDFKVARFQLACVLTVGMAIWYLTVEKGCRVPNAFQNGSCKLPDWFNHNAVIHLGFTASFWGTISSFGL